MGRRWIEIWDRRMLGSMAFRCGDQIREGGKWKEVERERENKQQKRSQKRMTFACLNKFSSIIVLERKL